MTDQAPAVRIDRLWGNEIELYVTEQMCYRLAAIIDAATLTGSIYTKLILPPDQAMAKAQLTQQGGQNG